MGWRTFILLLITFFFIVKNWLTFCLDNAIDDWLDQEIVDFEPEEG